MPVVPMLVVPMRVVPIFTRRRRALARSARLSSFLFAGIVAAASPRLWAAPPSDGKARAETGARTLTILGTTDTHGHVEGDPVGTGADPVVMRGGLALVAGYVANARVANPGRVLLVDSGDMMQGTLVSNLGEGRAVIAAMNEMGYAAAAVGNHEFDYGPVGERVVAREPADRPRGALEARAAEARFPLLTANITTSTGEAFAPNIRPFTLVVVDGVKVGIIGGTSEDTPNTTVRDNLTGLRVEPLAPALVRAAAAARAAGATVVIAIVHEGGHCTRTDRPEDLSSCKADAAGFVLARNLPPGTVDAIFGGHTHQAVAQFVAGVPVLQSYCNARALSRLDLRIDAEGHPMGGGARIYPPVDVCGGIVHGEGPCKSPDVPEGTVRSAMYEGRPVLASVRVTAAIAADVARARDKLGEPVGVVLSREVRGEYGSESALGDLAADALRRAGQADIGLVNGGGLRAHLPAGPLRYGTLFEAFPFENRLTIVRASGGALRRLLVHNFGGEKGILSVSGMTARARCGPTGLAVDIQLSDGKQLDEAATYRIATIDFLARGGDAFTDTLGRAAEVKLDDEAPLLRDLIAAELRLRQGPGKTAMPLFDLAAPSTARLDLPSPRPVRCEGAAGRTIEAK